MTETREGVLSWFKFNRKGIGYFAYSMHRFSGIVIAAYLYLHLAVLSNLLRGQATFNDLVRSMGYGPFGIFVVLDVLLSVVIFYHGANGVRLMLNEMGVGLNRHKFMFFALESAAMILMLLFLYFAWQEVLAGSGV